MHAPSTLTRGNGFNRLVAGVIGLAALAAGIVGTATLSDSIDLPFSGSESTTIERPVESSGLAQDYRFLEANVDLPAYGSLEAVHSVESIRFLEQNTILPEFRANAKSAAEIRFLETNSWDYPARAEPAGDTAQPPVVSSDEMRFIEDNTINLRNATAQGEIVPNNPY